MIKLPFHDNSGTPIDARFDVESRELVVHSRGGAIDSPNARNTQYGVALRLLLQRIKGSELTLAGVWVDSTRARKLPISQRQIFFPDDAEASPQALASRFSTIMTSVGRAPNARSGGGNSTKRLRLAFAGDPSDERIARVAGWGKTGSTKYNDRQLPLAAFDPVREDHVWRAVQRLAFQRVKHSFGESTDYDVIADDGSRLPPKAIFGIAASEALGFQVRPWHFGAGLDTRCFNTIKSAGYSIVRKDDDVPRDEVPVDPVLRAWVEGNQGLVTHLRRERSSGLAPAKKRAFKEECGRLYCERCKMEPAAVYGPEVGEACIEVHHKLPLGSAPGARETRLEDLMCVCANCHRIMHYEQRKALREHRGTP